MRVRRSGVGLALATVVAGVLLVAVAQGEERHRAGSGALATEGHAEGIVGVLRSAGPTAVLPANAGSELAAAGGTDVDVGATRLALDSGGWSMYVSPAANAACLTVTDPSGGASARCTSRENLESGAARPAMAMLGCEGPRDGVACERAVFFGIVPDGVDQTTVEFKDGSTAEGVVQNNVYMVSVPVAREPLTLSYGSRPQAPIASHPVGFAGTFAGE